MLYVYPRDRLIQKPEQELINGPLHRCRCWEISRAGLERGGRVRGGGREQGQGFTLTQRVASEWKKSGWLLGVEQAP